MERGEEFPDVEPATLEEAKVVIDMLSRRLREVIRERDEAWRMDLSIPILFNKPTIERFIDERTHDGRPFGLFMVDLNKFKTVNDTFGHKEGDGVLVRFSELMVEVFKRSTDTVVLGRVGGDEFMVIVDMATGGRRTSDVFAQMDNVYDLLREVEMEFLMGEPRLAALGVRFAIGSTLFDPSRPLGGRILYEQADEAMYEDKSPGDR